MTEALTKKVEQAVKLIQLAGADGEVVEVAYSGGKDSDVILELTKMAGIKYRAIYKNTTIDPPKTLAHVKEAGAEILKPKKTFFELVREHGSPSRFARFCCRYLKEYKVLDKAIMGVRKAESTKRAARYSEPTECRFYGSKKEHIEAFYPILEWSDQDVIDFITERGLKIHPLYYREDGSIDVTLRVGCMCCPLASTRKRLEQFKKWPNMVKAYIKAEQAFRESHLTSKNAKLYPTVYDWFFREAFFERQKKYEDYCNSLFEKPNPKSYIEDYFNIKL